MSATTLRLISIRPHHRITHLIRLYKSRTDSTSINRQYRYLHTVSMRATNDAPTVPLCVHAPTQNELVAARTLLSTASLTLPVQPKSDVPAPIVSLDYPALGETTPAADCGSFDTHTYYSTLQTTSMGRVLFTAKRMPSTQAIIQTNVTIIPDGTLCVADKQIGGKGRGGNTWESPEGCLMFSTCKRMSLPGERLPFVQYLVSLAVLQAVQDYAQALLGVGNTIDIKIKWPNDLYSGSLKLGGILCHSSCRNSIFYVIMGVGLNVTNSQPTTCVDDLIRQRAQQLGVALDNDSNRLVSREELLARMMNKLETMLDTLSNQGFGPYEEAYYQSWLHSGQRLEVEDAETKARTTVVVQGLSKSGYLMAQGESGERYELHPDGNSLDFLQGLVRRKMMS